METECCLSTTPPLTKCYHTFLDAALKPDRDECFTPTLHTPPPPLPLWPQATTTTLTTTSTLKSLRGDWICPPRVIQWEWSVNKMPHMAKNGLAHLIKWISAFAKMDWRNRKKWTGAFAKMERRIRQNELAHSPKWASARDAYIYIYV